MAEDKQFPIIELSDKAKERILRFKDFDSFYAKTIEFFEPFKSEKERGKRIIILSHFSSVRHQTRR